MWLLMMVDSVFTAGSDLFTALHHHIADIYVRSDLSNNDCDSHRLEYDRPGRNYV